MASDNQVTLNSTDPVLSLRCDNIHIIYNLCGGPTLRIISNCFQFSCFSCVFSFRCFHLFSDHLSLFCCFHSSYLFQGRLQREPEQPYCGICQAYVEKCVCKEPRPL